MRVTPSAAVLWCLADPPVDVQIIDVSRNGVGLTSASPLVAGSSVSIIRGTLTIKGTVTYCRELPSQSEYAVGVNITKVINAAVGKEI